MGPAGTLERQIPLIWVFACPCWSLKIAGMRRPGAPLLGSATRRSVRWHARAAARTLLDELAPLRCRLCEVVVAGDCALCHVCRGELAVNASPCVRCALPLPGATTAIPRHCPACLARPPPFTTASVPYCYDESLAYLIGRWKYHGERALTRSFAELWLDAMPRPAVPDLLIPVPLHWRRLLRRGFNQSAELAAQLAAPLGVLHPLRRPRLRRRVATRAQARMDRAQRVRNLRGAFDLVGSVAGQHVALVDDVCTTGATAEAAARALLDSGATRVDLWCLARTPP